MAFPRQAVKRSQSLQEQAYQLLREKILAGELAANERLIEQRLAEQLQVSRTPVREAMRQLQREGLVIADSGGGLRVARISVEDAMQLYDCRIALEQLAVVGACEHASVLQLQALESCLVVAEELVQASIAEENSTQLLEIDYRFHRLIAEGSGNRWLLTLLDQVFDKMSLLRAQTTRHNPQVLEIRSEHRQIYTAIADRNPQSATQAIRTHLNASKQRVAQEMQTLHQSLLDSCLEVEP